MATSSAHNKKQPKSQAGGQAGELFIVATPIGNLGDISLRALQTLKSVNLIACEDTRTSGVLLHHYGISTPRVSCHAHNEAEASAKLLEKLQAGETVALISDAGTPLVSDPGARLVTMAIEAGIRVTPIPGASALLSALAVAGLPTDRFFFAGFLPNKNSERAKLFGWLITIPATLIFYEAPHRLSETLEVIAAALGDRPASVARELTKLHETCYRGKLRELAQVFAERAPKGECVILVEGAQETVVSDGAIDGALRKRLSKSSLREAVDEVTALSRRARSDVYARALVLKKEQS
jgi:16S rRNA (cytidine1402-2'-O)-methyltransferase